MADWFDELWAFRGRLSRDLRRAERASSKSHTGHSRGTRRLPNHVNQRGGVVSKSSPHAQRVIVKFSSVKLAGSGRDKAAAHLNYLQRDGVGEDGTPAEVFGREGEDVCVEDFLSRSQEDRHQFRIILSPENGDALDLESYTRDVVSSIETDLGTKLDWLAVAHYNTDNPHVHIAIRGVDERDQTLFIRPTYIADGIRHRAQDVATAHLGPRSPDDIRRAAERDVSAERFTRIDRELVSRASTPDAPNVPAELHLESGRGLDRHSAEERNRDYRRLEKLSSLGLATRVDTHHWRLHPELKEELDALGRRGDIIKRMHATGRRDPTTWSLGPLPDAPVSGRVTHRGLADEHKGTEFLILEGTDGKTHYLDGEHFKEASRVSVGDIVCVDPDARLHVTVKREDTRSLRAQVDYDGPTWLDKQLVLGATPSADRGFGGEVGKALNARRERLQHLGLVDADGSIPNDLYRRTRAREFERLCRSWSKQTGKSLADLDRRRPFDGRVRDQVDLPGGQYTVVENERAVMVLRTDRYLRGRVGQDVQIQLREGKDGRTRPHVTALNNDDELGR